MYCQWYSADWCTDEAFASLEPEERANPSMSSWPEGKDYISQQRLRLPFFKFRRLHLNLPGSPEGSIFNADVVMGAVVPGRKALQPDDVTAMLGSRPKMHGYVDMSGGSGDDAVLAVAFQNPQTKKLTLASIMSQTGKPPFNPRSAVAKFSQELSRWGISQICGDAYAGQTFRQDFQEHGILYKVHDKTTSEVYEAFEVVLNAGEVELLDVQKMQDQFLGLVLGGSKIDHLPGEHDDWSAAAAGALTLAKTRSHMVISDAALEAAQRGPGGYVGGVRREMNDPALRAAMTPTKWAMRRRLGF